MRTSTHQPWRRFWLASAVLDAWGTQERVAPVDAPSGARLEAGTPPRKGRGGRKRNQRAGRPTAAGQERGQGQHDKVGRTRPHCNETGAEAAVPTDATVTSPPMDLHAVMKRLADLERSNARFEKELGGVKRSNAELKLSVTDLRREVIAFTGADTVYRLSSKARRICTDHWRKVGPQMGIAGERDPFLSRFAAPELEVSEVEARVKYGSTWQALQRVKDQLLTADSGVRAHLQAQPLREALYQPQVLVFAHAIFLATSKQPDTAEQGIIGGIAAAFTGSTAGHAYTAGVACISSWLTLRLIERHHVKHSELELMDRDELGKFASFVASSNVAKKSACRSTARGGPDSLQEALSFIASEPVDGTGAAIMEHVVTARATKDARFDQAVNRVTQEFARVVPLLLRVDAMKDGQSLDGKGPSDKETVERARVHLSALARRLVRAMADEAVLADSADAAETTEV